MYFSHERASPMQSPRHRIDYDKTKNDWVQTNFETDQFEEEQFEQSREIFQTNVQNERRKEEEGWKGKAINRIVILLGGEEGRSGEGIKRRLTG